MGRVAVIGNTAGGKSTMCKALSESKGLPVHAVDKIQWNPGWTFSPEVEVEEKLNEIIKTDLWIIDGWGPWKTIERRFNAADTIIFVDHSIGIHFWWAFKRQILVLFFPERLDKPEGCTLLHVTCKLFKMIWRIHRQLRPKLLKLVDSYKGRKKVFHIKSPTDLRRFMIQYC